MTFSKKSVIVIGAGLGGLTTAVRLAKAGFAVTVFEKNSTVGGKVNLVESNGYKFDTGASLITMRHVFAELFSFCERKLEDYLEFLPLEPICRYFWTDGTTIDTFTDLEKTENEIARISPEDATNFRRFLEDSQTKYEIAEKTFLSHSLNDLPKLLRPKYLPDLLKISSFKNLDAHHRQFFKSPKIRQLFNRFATYNGSSPYQTPATFALIPFVEFGLGAWSCKGGIYKIPQALEKLAKEFGVKIFNDCEVEKILVEKGRAVGVKVNGENVGSDFVVANSDAIQTYRKLLNSRKYQRREPSCSGFVLLLGTKKKFSKLAHHNIFFSDNYRKEFEMIFKQKIPAENPTIYVCASSRTDSSQAPEGHENLFVLVNAPYLSSAVNWQREASDYRRKILAKLENEGLSNLTESLDYEKIITPKDFEIIYRANKGSIYGASSNGLFSAFLRVPNKSNDVENLFFAGGVTHPGGGMPLVLLSGKMASDLIIKKASQ